MSFDPVVIEKIKKIKEENQTEDLNKYCFF